MSPVEAVRSVYANYSNFDDRAIRSEYWWYTLFSAVVGLALRLPGSDITNVIGIGFTVVSFIPSLAVAVRRLHDTEHSGWWLLLPLAPLIFVIFEPFGSARLASVLIVFGILGCQIAVLVLLCMDGTPGPNRFGPIDGASSTSAEPNGGNTSATGRGLALKQSIPMAEATGFKTFGRFLVSWSGTESLRTGSTVGVALSDTEIALFDERWSPSLRLSIADTAASADYGSIVLEGGARKFLVLNPFGGQAPDELETAIRVARTELATLPRPTSHMDDTRA